MKSFLRLFLPPLFLIFSCHAPSETHLSPKKMQAVLLDLQLAEAYSIALNQDSMQRNTIRDYDSLAVFYRAVWKKHGITEAQYLESLQWYKQHPEQLDSIYNRMIPEISRLESIYQ